MIRQIKEINAIRYKNFVIFWFFFFSRYYSMRKFAYGLHANLVWLDDPFFSVEDFQPILRAEIFDKNCVGLFGSCDNAVYINQTTPQIGFETRMVKAFQPLSVWDSF